MLTISLIKVYIHSAPKRFSELYVFLLFCQTYNFNFKFFHVTVIILCYFLETKPVKDAPFEEGENKCSRKTNQKKKNIYRLIRKFKFLMKWPRAVCYYCKRGPFFEDSGLENFLRHITLDSHLNSNPGIYLWSKLNACIFKDCSLQS